MMSSIIYWNNNDWLADMEEHDHPEPNVPAVNFAPFQCLIHEQAKSIVALQELQHDVSHLLAFRDAVLSMFPHLNTMLLNSGSSVHPPQTWTRRRHLQNQHKTFSSEGKETATTSSGVPGVADSGFNSEAKESSGSTSTASPRSSRWLDYSQSHSAMVQNITPHGHELKHQLERLRTRIRREEFPYPNRYSRKSTSPIDEKDELWALLDAIENKGVQMKHDLDTFGGKGDLRSTSKERYRLSLNANASDDSYGRNVTNGTQSSYDTKRDLIERITETESRLQTTLLELESTKKDRDYYSYAYSKAESELKAIQNAKLTVEKELKFTKDKLLCAQEEVKLALEKLDNLGESSEKSTKLKTDPVVHKRVDEISVTVNGSPIFPKKLVRSAAQLNLAELVSSQHVDEENLGVRNEDILSVIRERSLVGLQRMLLKKMMEYSILKGRLREKTQSELSLLEPGEVSKSQELEEQNVKLRDENEELKFLLEEQKIELEGTKAQLRVSRQLSIKQKRTLTSSVLIQTDSPKVAFVLTQTPDILNDAVDTGTQTVEKSVSPCQQYLSNPALDTIKTQSRIPTPIKSRASSLIRTRGDTSIGSLTSLGSKGDKKGNSLRTENKGSPEAVKEKPKRDVSLRFDKNETRPSLEKKCKRRVPSCERIGPKSSSNDGKVDGVVGKRIRNRTTSSILEMTLDDCTNDGILKFRREPPQYCYLGSNKLAIFQNRYIFRKSASHGDGLNNRCFSPIIMNALSGSPRIY
ncbi:centrosomal protein of 290 kDa-like isoform X3 [Artemia franciscana]|uniref:centrosomal protein of 290 kDa-like isoform X3 n=1 Tax=Artemia franciscana TaxID=6661 RepID=UPI0032DA7605